MFSLLRGRRGRGGSIGRSGLAGEFWTCGAPAHVVFDDPRLGPAFGSCLDLHPVERTGTCAFCGVSGRHVTAGVCPAYVLRPAWATDPARRALATTHQTGEAA